MHRDVKGASSITSIDALARYNFFYKGRLVSTIAADALNLPSDNYFNLHCVTINQTHYTILAAQVPEKRDFVGGNGPPGYVKPALHKGPAEDERTIR
jgi:hypothetical protein